MIHKLTHLWWLYIAYVNPLVMNGLSHPNNLDESTFSLRDIGDNHI